MRTLRGGGGGASERTELAALAVAVSNSVSLPYLNTEGFGRTSCATPQPTTTEAKTPVPWSQATLFPRPSRRDRPGSHLTCRSRRGHASDMRRLTLQSQPAAVRSQVLERLGALLVEREREVLAANAADYQVVVCPRCRHLLA